MRALGVVLLLALGLTACNRPPERPPMPKTGEAAQGRGTAPSISAPQDQKAPTAPAGQH